MKKKIVIIMFILLVAIGIVGLYQTFAASSTIVKNDSSYDISLSNTTTVGVSAGEGKTIFYQVTNNNKGVVQYGVGYTSNNTQVQVYYDSIDPASGTIDYGENKFIKLRLINDGASDEEVTISTVLGYEHGGDLVVPSSNVVLVTEVFGQPNLLMSVLATDADDNTDVFLRYNDKGEGLLRNQIRTVTFSENIAIPSGNTSVDVSSSKDGTVMMWYGSADSDGFYDVYIGSSDGKTIIRDGSYLFSRLINVKTINFANNIDTTNMSSTYLMFNANENLMTIDFSGVVTSSVTDMSAMFQNCYSLVSLNINGWDTSNVTKMYGMFVRCKGLKTIDISNWNFSNVQVMYAMFYGCTNITSLDLSGWDTGNVTNMSYMFYSGGSDIRMSLTTIDGIGNLDTSKVTDMRYMFYGCTNIASLDLSGWDTGNVTNMSNMFNSGISEGEANPQMALTTIGDVSNWDTSKVADMSYMFRYCYYLTELNVSNWDVSSVTKMTSMFRFCNEFASLDLSNWNVSNVTSMSHMFYGCRKLTTLGDLSNWDTGKVGTTAYMFFSCFELTSLEDLSNWNVSGVKDMQGMFCNCRGLTTLDVGNWDTSSVTNMNRLFSDCYQLSYLDVSNWDVSNVTDMGYMFGVKEASNKTPMALTTIGDISGWNTEKVTNMQGMFHSCSKLTSLDLGDWNTANLSSIVEMFEGCTLLSTLDVSGWNTSKVKKLTDLFASCSSLIELDLSGWDTSIVDDTRWLFTGCTSLSTIYVGDNWNMSAVTDSTNMFNNCTSLVGGSGTVFDSTKIDVTYAKVDEGTSSPGYFTYKAASA